MIWPNPVQSVLYNMPRSWEIVHRNKIVHMCYAQSRTQSNACARARMALAVGKLTTGTPKFRGSGFVGMHVKPITAQEKFNFPRANAILARAQALLWVRDCVMPAYTTEYIYYMSTNLNRVSISGAGCIKAFNYF